MTTLLSIDPGGATGVALFFIGPDCAPALVSADVVAPDDVKWSRFMPDIVVIECPERVYGKARAKDIISLALIVGRYVERFKGTRLRLVTPHAWKGSIDGDIMVRRIEAAFTPAEQKVAVTLPTTSKRHNAIDAIGMGKWAFRQPWMRGVV